MSEVPDKQHLLQQKLLLSNQITSIISRLSALENKLQARLEEPLHRIVRAHYQSLIQMQKPKLALSWKVNKQVLEQLRRLEQH